MPFAKDRKLLRVGIFMLAAAFSVASLYLQSLLQSISNLSPFSLLYFCVFLSSFFGGYLAGILSWLIVIVGALFILVPPYNQISIPGLGNSVSLLVFSLFSIGVIILLEHSRDLRRRLQNSLVNLRNLEKRRTRDQSVVKRISDLNLLGIFYFTTDGRITEANESFLRMIGYTQDEILENPLSWSELTPERWSAADEEALLAVSTRGFSDIYEKEFRCKDGRLLPVLIGGSTFEGRENEGAAFVLNIEKQKNLENLREELQLLIESSSQFVALTDEKGMITFLNQRAKDLLKPPNENSVHGLRLTELISPYDLSQEAQASFSKSQSAIEEGFELDVMLASPFNGAMIPMHLQSFPLVTVEGEVPLRYAFLGSDLRHEIENQERLQTALEVAQMAIWQYDYETGEYSRSGEHDRLYGFEANLPEWTDDIFYSLLHPLDEKRVQKLFEGLANNEDTEFSINYRIRLPDNTTRWLSSRGKVIRQDGKVRKLVGGILDITQLKKIESDLKKALRIRDQFLSIASHELKTPITSIQLQMELLTHHLGRITKESSVEVNAILEVILESKQQFDRLTGLIDDLLDVTRIANGKLQLETSEINLESLWASVIKTFSYAPGVVVKISGEPCPLTLDEDRMRQVMTNLLSNAIKFGLQKEIQVELDYSACPDVVSFKVKDQGIGIDEDELDQIFDRFGQAHSGKERKGLGLGLFISREIVKAHRGEISVSSQKGLGTAFEVKIPTLSGPETRRLK